MEANNPEENSEPEFRSFSPCVGDIVMKGYPPEDAEYTPSCGVVTHVYQNELGERFYFVQMNRALILAKGAERLTQAELDLLHLHPATVEEWRKNMREVEEWYEGEKSKLYEAIEPYVSSAGK